MERLIVSKKYIPLPVFILGCGILLQAAVVFCYSVTRVTMLAGGTVDIGIYMQVLRALNAYGAPLATLTLLPGEQNLLGAHFTPLLYLLAPLYALFPSPVCLEAVHSIAIALAAIPVYLAARALGLERRAACIAALAYLFNPFTIGAGVWGFMDSSLSVLWMAIAIWGLAARRFYLVLIGGALLLLTKEHYGVSVMMMGLLWWKFYGLPTPERSHDESKFSEKSSGFAQAGDRRRGLMLGAAGLAAVLLVMLVVMPYFRGSFIHPMLSAGSNLYGWLLLPGSWGVVLPPLLKSDLQYITVLLGMFCFLPIAGCWWLLAGAADFAVTLLSANPANHGVFDCHSLPLMPVLAVAACAGYKRFGPPSRVLVPVMVLIGLAYVYLAALPLPLSVNVAELPVVPRFSLAPVDAGAVRAINALLPPDAKIAVQSNIGMFFIRRYMVVFPSNETGPDGYAVLNLDSPWKSAPFIRCADFGVYAQWVKDMLDDPNVHIIYWQKPWLVMGHGKDIPGARAQAKETLAQFINMQYRMCKLWSGQ